MQPEKQQHESKHKKRKETIYDQEINSIISFYPSSNLTQCEFSQPIDCKSWEVCMHIEQSQKCVKQKKKKKNVIGDQFTVRNLIMKINHNISAHIWNYYRENVNVNTCV